MPKFVVTATNELVMPINVRKDEQGYHWRISDGAQVTELSDTSAALPTPTGNEEGGSVDLTEVYRRLDAIAAMQLKIYLILQRLGL